LPFNGVGAIYWVILSTALHFHTITFTLAKTHPAFNDDYDIAWALISIAASKGVKSLKEAFPTPDQWMTILQNFHGDDAVSWIYANFSGAIPRPIVRQLCEEIYFGKDEYLSINGKAPAHYKCRGMWKQEKLIIDTHWKNFSLTSLHFHRKIVERVFAGG